MNYKIQQKIHNFLCADFLSGSYKFFIDIIFTPAAG